MKAAGGSELTDKTVNYTKEYQKNYCDVINIVSQLEGEDALKDPDSNPFQSLYAARSMIITLINFVNLKNISEEKEKLLVYLFINLRLANNYLETEERAEACKMLNELYQKLVYESFLPIQKILKDEEIIDSEIATLYGSQIVLLFANLGLAYSPSDPEEPENKQATFWLNKALHIIEKLFINKHSSYFYESFLANENISPFFHHFSEKYCIKLEEFILKNLKTQLLYMTAQAFLNSGNKNQSAYLLQKTIAEVITNKKINSNFEECLMSNHQRFRITNPIFFVNINHLTNISLANNSASLAVYFISCLQFYESADCLLSATELILMTSEKDEDHIGTFANICRIFVDHCLNMFKISLRDPEKTKVPVQKRFTCNSSGLFNLEFKKSQEFWKIKDLNSLLKFPKEYADALKLFKTIEFGINEAEKFFQYDGKCTDFVMLEKMRADNYMYLAQFEKDPKNAACLHKQRINIFQKFIEELTSNHFDDLKISLRFNLGQAFFDYREAKDSELRLESADAPRIRHLIEKSTRICQKCIEAYQDFLQNYRDLAQRKFKIDIFKDKCKEPKDVFMLVQAQIHIAQLYSLMTSHLEGSRSVETILKAIENYKMAISLADINERFERSPENNTISYLDEEVGLASEMIEILSERLHRVSL